MKTASHRRARGFTLIELGVAITLLALMLGAVSYGVGALTGSKARSATGELAGVIRSLYDTAALSGKTCRLVFELPDAKEEEGNTHYRAECAEGATTARSDREDEVKDDRRKKELEDRRFESQSDKPTLESLMAQEKNRVESAFKYSSFSAPEIQAREIPSDVKVSVWTRHQRDRIRSGLAYLYFFPQGFTEKAHIYVEQGDNIWTITVAPLTGKTSVFPEEIAEPRS